MDDSPTIQDSVATNTAVVHPDALEARYREAVRARYKVDRNGSTPRSVARLERSVHRFEDLAASVNSPSRQHYLESARLIRAGDLTGAKGAFDAGRLALVADAAVAPGRVDVPLTSDVGVVAPGIDVAVAARAVSWDRIALAAYLALLTIGEVAVTFGNPLLVFPLHGGIVALASLQVAWLEGPSRPEVGRHPLTPFLLAFIVVALIRIISYTLPLAAIDPAYRYLFAGVPMTLGALLAARAAGFSMRDVGGAWRMGWLQMGVIVASAGLGFLEFAILRPAAMGPLPWVTAGLIPAVTVGIATGLPEELIFRGVLQTATRPILGRQNWVYVSLVFAVLHIGYQSPLDLVFVFGVGLLYGWVFERSRSIVGVSIGHGLVNMILFFVAPNLPAIMRLVGIQA